MPLPVQIKSRSPRVVLGRMELVRQIDHACLTMRLYVDPLVTVTVLPHHAIFHWTATTTTATVLLREHQTCEQGFSSSMTNAKRCANAVFCVPQRTPKRRKVVAPSRRW